VALSTMKVEIHGGGRVVRSLMAVENGAIAFARTIFVFPAISPQWTQSMDMSHSTGTNRVMLHSYNNGEWASESVVVGLGLSGKQCTDLCQVRPMVMVGHYSWCPVNVHKWIPSFGTISPQICQCRGVLIPPHIATALSLWESVLDEHSDCHVYYKWSKLGGLLNGKAGLSRNAWCWFKIGIWHEPSPE
jgi:hypothetical protein